MSPRLRRVRTPETNNETRLTHRAGAVGIAADLVHNSFEVPAIKTTESGMMRTGVYSALLSLQGVLLGALLAAGAAGAQHVGQPQTDASHHSQRQRPARVDALEQRVQLLTHELDLNAQQQQAVRKILLGQREAVKQIWQDPAIAPAERAPAVRLVGERTADQIRAVLNEEQRNKYNRPLPDSELATRAGTYVEGWLKTVRGQTSANPLGVTLPAGQ